MALYSPEKLEEIAAKLLVGAGAPESEAAIVAKHCIEANLAGHDSHGIINIPQYIQRVEVGHIVPGAPYEITQETDTTTVVDGHWGFGYVVSEFAMKRTIEKAERNNVAATTVFRQGHVGRVADYPIMAAEAGMIGIMTADSGRAPKAVAPFGGREPRLGTNPISFAVPSALDGPLFIDMATSAAAAGKIKVALARKESVPNGWIIDKDGNASNDPAALGGGGALLPLGGSEGYKGYGLSTMVEILSAILPGLGFGVEPTGRHNDGCFMVAIKVDAFRPLETFKQEVSEFATYLKDTPRASGVEEIYYPGEIEFQRANAKRNSGIEVETATIDNLNKVAEKYGVDLTW